MNRDQGDRGNQGDRDDSGDAHTRSSAHPPTASPRQAKSESREPRAIMSVFPTLCTLGNLVAGFAAIHYAAKPVDYIGPLGWSGLSIAAMLVFVGMIFDAIDGSIARLTKSTTDLGAQLDSLCDMVTFGLVPAFMTIVLVSHYVGDPATSRDVTLIGPGADTIFGRVIWAVAAVYVCCAALRLARFNVETPSSAVQNHMVFRGLPSPGAAGAVVSLILLQQYVDARFADDEVPQHFVRAWALGIPFIVILTAIGMVSSLPYVHVVNRYFRGRRSFQYVTYLVILLVLFIWEFQYVLALAFCAYALSAPVKAVWQLARRRH
jgi:CDP-diacylglycerol---serine O-phosphatidyltransferase